LGKGAEGDFSGGKARGEGVGVVMDLDSIGGGGYDLGVLGAGSEIHGGGDTPVAGHKQEGDKSVYPTFKTGGMVIFKQEKRRH
jgi:hypothetical protein